MRAAPASAAEGATTAMSPAFSSAAIPGASTGGVPVGMMPSVSSSREPTIPGASSILSCLFLSVSPPVLCPDTSGLTRLDV